MPSASPILAARDPAVNTAAVIFAQTATFPRKRE